MHHLSFKLINIKTKIIKLKIYKIRIKINKIMIMIVIFIKKFYMYQQLISKNKYNI